MEIPTQVTFTAWRKVRKDQPNVGDRVWMWEPGDAPLSGKVVEVQGWEFESHTEIDVDKVRVVFDDKSYQHLNKYFHKIDAIYPDRDSVIESMEAHRKDITRWIGELEEMEDESEDFTTQDRADENYVRLAA